MQTQWIEFQTGASKSKVHVTFSTRGSISITKGAMEKFGLTQDKDLYAKLFCSLADRKVGIRFFQNPERNTVKVGHREGMGCWILGRTFMRQFTILPAVTSAFDVEKDGDMLVVDLNSAKPRNNGIQKPETD